MHARAQEMDDDPDLTVEQEIDRDSAMTGALKYKNTIEVGFGGSGLAISASYRRKLAIRPRYYLNASVGVGTVPLSGGIVIPHQLSVNLGKWKNYFELGIAGTYWTGYSNASGYAERIYSYQLSPLAGYRRHFFNRMVIRVYANPLFHISGEYYLEDWSFIPYAGISIGHAF
jgi:hypothetical protein